MYVHGHITTPKVLAEYVHKVYVFQQSVEIFKPEIHSLSLASIGLLYKSLSALLNK